MIAKGQGPRIELFGRAACTLCDEARDLILGICEETGETFTELDVDSDPTLRNEYGELVPVVLVDGEQVGYWRIDPKRLRAALAKS